MTSPTPRREIPRDPAFRPSDQAQIALHVGSLDDQSRRLETIVEGLGAADLEWQPRPGRNSVGMLLAHVALTEAFWTAVACGRGSDEVSADALCREIVGLGLPDDGMPLSADGGHPATLAGWDLARHLDTMRRARRFLRAQAGSWTDAGLADVATYQGREFTREWILYHLLEHLAQHAGQIGLVLAMKRAAS